MKKPYCCFAAGLVALCCVAGTQVLAADTDNRRYTLPDHGSLQLKVPTVWKEEIAQDRDRLFSTIVFTGKSGASFGVVLMPSWPTEQGAPNPDREAVQRFVQRAAGGITSQAVEQTIEVLKTS